jgi:hypothetical protein
MHPALGHSPAARRGSSCDTALHRHPAEAQSPHCQMVWLPALAPGPQLCCQADASLYVQLSCHVCAASFTASRAGLLSCLHLCGSQPAGYSRSRSLVPRPGAPATETSQCVYNAEASEPWVAKQESPTVAPKELANVFPCGSGSIPLAMGT